MSHQEYDYPIKIMRVIDGDTVDATLTHHADIGFHITAAFHTVQRLRLLGVDTPERGQPGWATAKEYVTWWTEGPEPLRARTSKGDSFGRWLADIYKPSTGESLTAALITNGLGRVYP